MNGYECKLTAEKNKPSPKNVIIWLKFELEKHKINYTKAEFQFASKDTVDSEILLQEKKENRERLPVLLIIV